MRRHRLTFLAPALALLSCAACGPVSPQVRRAVQGSPYRNLTLVPLRRGADQTPVAAQAHDLLVTRLGRLGFDVNEAFPDEARAPAPKKRRGRNVAPPQAVVPDTAPVLTGNIEEAWERTETIPEVVEFRAVPPPKCCSTPMTPCQEPQDVLDEQLGQVVNACLAGSHKRVVKKPARMATRAAFAAHLELRDPVKNATVWDGRDRQESSALDKATDLAIRRLADQLADAVSRAR